MSGPVSALLRKELLLERRAPTVVPAMLLFSVATFVVFHFALNRSGVEGDLAAGVLWVTLLFSAFLGAGRLFVVDEEEGGFDAFLLSPADRSALLVAKAATFLTFLAAVQVVAVPAFVLLLLGPSPPVGAFAKLALVCLMADLGIAALGTLVGGMAVRTRSRDLLTPLILLPLMIPVVIGAARASAPLLAQAGARALPGRDLLLLGLYDLVFVLVTYAVFDFLLDD